MQNFCGAQSPKNCFQIFKGHFKKYFKSIYTNVFSPLDIFQILNAFIPVNPFKWNTVAPLRVLVVMEMEENTLKNYFFVISYEIWYDKVNLEQSPRFLKVTDVFFPAVKWSSLWHHRLHFPPPIISFPTCERWRRHSALLQ